MTNNKDKDGVLIFTFSPVQGFIESSRRTRDFFTGSYILSWLTFRVMWRLNKEKGIDMGDFVYPIPDDQPLWKLFDDEEIKDIDLLAVANFPNRFVLRVEYKTGKQLIQDIKKIFYEEWKKLYDHVYEQFIKGHDNSIKEQFKAQVENYFTPFIVVVKDIDFDNYEKLFEPEDRKDLDYIGEQQRDKKYKYTYGYTYDLAERILGSRKTLRPYRGVVDYPKGADLREFESCSVCGERKALAIRWDDLKNDYNYDIQDDRLCGVCLVKRLGYKYFEKVFKEETKIKDSSIEDIFKHFPSTREIAGVKFKGFVFNNWEVFESGIKDYLDGIREVYKRIKDLEGVFTEEENDAKRFYEKLKAFLEARTHPIRAFKIKVFDKYKDEFLRTDAALFHIDEWNNAITYLSKLGIIYDIEEWKGFLKGPKFAYKVDSKDNKEEHLIHSNSYFAIFYADGDHMGKWLGLKQEIRGEPLTEEFHKDFSKAISEYALEDVPQVVEKEHPGKLVYAGGDDVFAFVHPWDVMSILDKLRSRFESRLEKFPTVEGIKPSMSAGVVIGHAKAPLKRLIKNVRKAEKIAKNDFGRNAFVIRVVVRSGSTWDFGGKWEYSYNGRTFDTAEEFNKTMKLLMDDGENIEGVKCNLSSNFVYDIRDMLATFEPTEFDEDALRIFESLFKRSFRRKFRCSGNKDENKRALESAINNYLDFMKAMIHTHIEEAKNNDSEVNENEIRYKAVENFANMFYVARFIAKEVKL